MTNKYKKEREEYNRRIYNNKSLAELKIIGKKKGLLNVDQYKKANKNVLIERLVKGSQLKDERKDVLLEKAQNKDLIVNKSMSKKDILKKISSQKLADLNKEGLRKLAEKKGIPLRSQITRKDIIERLKNPTNYYTVESLKRLARSNNIDVRRNINKQELINILGERNLITTTPITAQESNLGVLASNVPIEIIRKAKKRKAQSAHEDLENYKEYIKNLKSYNISAGRLKQITKQLERKEKKAKEEKDRIFTPTREASAFKNYTNQYVMYNTITSLGSLVFLEFAKPAILNIFNSNRNIKTALYLHCLMERIAITGDKVIKEFAFHSKDLKLVLEETDESELYNEMVDEIDEEMREVQNAEGSGWQFLKSYKIGVTYHKMGAIIWE